ncbi:hypothetical protein U9M48_040542 [Paspalum notatum var. saurae]|uniref:Reverse transcriptase domain-containing protein n=1 Tax=Paspalum notatum var. saurae TaxID=547442 RepID=A0AAQ3XFP3_PASNO
MSRVKAWCGRLELIPGTLDLHVVEPSLSLDVELTETRTLYYSIRVSVSSPAAFSLASPPAPPPDAGDHDRSQGGRRQRRQHDPSSSTSQAAEDSTTTPRGPVHARLGPRCPGTGHTVAASSYLETVQPIVAEASSVDEGELMAPSPVLCMAAPSPVLSTLGIGDAGSQELHSFLATAQLRTTAEEVAPACSPVSAGPPAGPPSLTGLVEDGPPEVPAPEQPSEADKTLKIKILKKKAGENVHPPALHHSRRVAGAKPCSPGPIVTAAQRKVIKSLGLSDGKEVIDQKAQDDYSKLFEQPLTDVDLSALAAIFGWQTDLVVDVRGWELLAGFWLCGVFRLVVLLVLPMNPSSILVWNARGLNKKARRNSVRETILSSRPDIVYLQETKVAAVSSQLLLTVFGSAFDKFVSLPADGSRGGILIAWKGACCHAISSRVDRYSVSIQFAEQEGRNWWFTGVYGPQEDEHKIQFLQELRDIRALCAGPWMVAGEFNLIYQAADKNNANLNRAMMGRFRKFLDDTNLKEFPLHGRKFTWSNERSSPTLRLSKGLQKWSQRKVGNIRLQLEMTKEILHRLEIARDNRALSTGEEDFRRKLKLHSLGLASLERTVARLRSRILYLREGDANTSFFHQQARYRKKKNFIAKFSVEDELITSQEDKQQAAHDYFDALLGSAEQRDFTLDLHSLELQHHDLSELDEPFTEEEVWVTIRELPMDKAPGPDGFTGRFYKTCWSVIKDDTGHVSKFKLLNSAFITLLPKKVDALQVKDFRPISLIHSFAKLLLTNRLAPKLPELVSVNQSAFVKGQSILDNFLMVQQLARSLHISKTPHVLLKLDISKAFDLHIGFGCKWCNLISLLLSTSSTRILINSMPGNSIYHHRGLHQGDPLSSMLFILVMEVLNSLLTFSTQEHLLQPIACQQAKHRVSFYADDVIMFLRPLRTDLLVITQLLDLLPCELKEFPCDYLGLPLTIRKLTKSELLPLVDKVPAKLLGWKATLVSKAGRLVMVKVVLSSIPIYSMLALDLPKWVLKAIDKRRRGFLWKGKEQLNGGNCPVAWESVQRPLQFEGLGVLNLQLFGWALRVCWLWLQKTDASCPWAGLPIRVPPNVQAFWLQGQKIADLAPNLFLLIPKKTRKQRTVAQGLQDRSWVHDIRGALSVQVLVEYLQLWNLIDNVELQHDTLDQHTWRLSNLGIYSSKSAYEAFFTGTIKFSPWRCIWKTWAPLKCKLFIWLAVKNRCWTADRLAKRGLPHPSACPLCDQAAETIQHILISCVFSREVWTSIFQKLGLLALAPQPGCRSFIRWWGRFRKAVPKELRKGLNSLITLVA